jgi:hypothetical protein
VTRAARTVIAGAPEQAHISTSFVERQNLTMRMGMHRFTRLTNAFSKKLENLEEAVALHFAHYNLVRLHKTLRVTPAMAAGGSNRLWSMEELVDRTSNSVMAVAIGPQLSRNFLKSKQIIVHLSFFFPSRPRELGSNFGSVPGKHKSEISGKLSAVSMACIRRRGALG